MINAIPIQLGQDAMTDKGWLCASRCAEILEYTKSYVIRKAQTQNWVTRHAKYQGGDAYEYYVPSMPAAFQRRLYEAAPDMKPEASVVGVPASGKMNPITLNDIKSSPKKLEQLQLRLKAVNEVKTRLKLDRRASKTETITQVADEYGFSKSSLYRWMNDPDAVIDTRGAKMGSRTLTDEMRQQLVNILYDENHKGWLGQQVIDEFKRRCLAMELIAPSDRTLYRFIEAQPANIKVMAQEGKGEWERKYGYRCERDLNAIPAGEEFIADTRIMDVMVMPDDWEYLDDPKPFRPQLVMWRDIKSGYIPSYSMLEVSPRAEDIGESFLKMATPLDGRPDKVLLTLPKCIYIDNGRDYNAERLYNAFKDGLFSILLTGIELQVLSNGKTSSRRKAVTNAIPYSSWSKGSIEGTFPHIGKWERTLKGFCGKDAKDRPKCLTDEIRKGELMTFSEFKVAFQGWIDEWNSHELRRLKSERKHYGLKECTAVRVFEQECRPVIMDRRVINYLSQEKREASVMQSGITMNKRTYWHENLGRFIGEKVLVMMNQHDDSEVMVILNKEVLCFAQALDKMSPRASREDFEALNHKKKAWRQLVDSHIKSARSTESWPAAESPDPETLDTGKLAARAIPFITGVERQAGFADDLLKNSAETRIQTERDDAEIEFDRRKALLGRLHARVVAESV